MNMGKLLPKIQLAMYTRELTWGRNPMNVMDVGKLYNTALSYYTALSTSQQNTHQRENSCM